MPEHELKVETIRVIYICDELGCGEEQTCRSTSSRGIPGVNYHQSARHMCRNGHVKDFESTQPQAGYPRTEYRETGKI